MTTAAQRKGDKAEREVRSMIAEHLGIDAPRLRAGATIDVGDLRIPGCVIEVKSYDDFARAVRDGITESVTEQANAGTPFGAAFIRRRGGTWVVALTPDQFFALYREATA